MKPRHLGLIVLSTLFFTVPAWAQDEPADDAPEAAEATDDAGTPAAGATAPVAEEAPGTAETGEAEEGGEVLGPGGKPLRTDYPGTPESKEARMDTQQIQGLEVDPGEPQAAYGLRIRELETKIDDLKEKVFQSKTRIVLLRETLLSGNLAGARAVIMHKTELGSAWKLQQAYYALDGTKLYNRTDKDGDLSDKRVFQVYDGSVAPGSHNLSVLVKYRGTNVGLFPYFKGYDGDIKSSCTFRAQEGKVAQVQVTVYPDGGFTKSIETRPLVKCEVEYLDNIRQDGKAAAANSTSDAAQPEQ